MIHAIESRQKKLDAFFKRSQQADIDDEIRSDLARFGAVLVCGFVERSVEIIIIEHLQKRAHERVIQFVRSHFKRGTNYDCEAICQLLERFDQRWNTRFKKFMEENSQITEAVRSAYTLRNSIAHGGDASRGLAGVAELYRDSKVLIEGMIEALR